MATLRDFIASQSTLVDGSLVRDHIQNPCDCDGEGVGGFLDCGQTADVIQTALEADMGTVLSASVVIVPLESNLEETLSTSISTETLTSEVCS